MNLAATTDPARFIARWRKAFGGELANAQRFVTELYELMDLAWRETAADVARELVRPLRPEFQKPSAAKLQMATQFEADFRVASLPSVPAGGRQPWQNELLVEVRAVADVVAVAWAPLSVEAIATHYGDKGALEETSAHTAGDFVGAVPHGTAG